MRILHAWLKPLYNNQQFKNMEIIVIDEHNTNMQATVRMDKLKRFQHHLKEDNTLTIQRYSLDKIKPKFRAIRLNARCGDYAQQFNDFLNSCDDHDRIVLVLQFAMICGTFGTVIIIQEDEGWWYLGCWACCGKVIKSTDYIDLESEMPKKPDGPNDWWFRLQIHVQDETGTMSLSLFNDEVQAMVGRSAYQLCEKYAKSKSDGSILTDITNLIGNEYAFKVAIDDYNVKKLLLVFTVLRFFNDQEIINSVLACVTPFKAKIINGTHFGNEVIIPRQPWVVHDDVEDFNVYETYTDLFSIKVNYGDSFTPKGGKEYVLGYSATDVRYYYFFKPETNLDYGLVALGSDQDVKDLFKYVVVIGDFS
nr:replication protein A 70 kDa DNA-binding subunit B [Tanacetum cinerariifolium]